MGARMTNEREEQLVEERIILVADSDVRDRATVCLLLQRFGYRIVAAASLKEATALLDVASPAAAIVSADLADPEALTGVRGNRPIDQLPLIVLANLPNPEWESRVRRQEIAALIPKPPKVETLYRTIQEVVERGLRRNFRIVTYLMATLEDDLPRGDGYVTVLSEFGLFFRTLNPRPVYTRLPVHFTIQDRTLRSDAIVLYVTTFDQGPFREPGMGMQFVGMRDEDRAWIRKYLHERVERGERLSLRTTR